MALEIDAERFEIRMNGKEVYLTPTEWDLLMVLKKADGRVLSRVDLLKAYGNKHTKKTFSEIQTRTIDQHVARIRRTMGRTCPIRTVKKRGYKFRELA